MKWVTPHPALSRELPDRTLILGEAHLRAR
jgi:hypothetical protein